MKGKAMFTFNATGTGYSHISKKTNSEDYSGSISNDNERYYIAIVADGHGAEECFRSNEGSKFAVEVAKECLEKFAKSITTSTSPKENETVIIAPRPFSEELLCNSENYRNQEIKRLTDTIIDRWHDRVKNHYKHNPPTKEELEEKKVKDINNLSEDEKFHIYGTTLIAALMLPKCLILIQQGDGRCEVFIESNDQNPQIGKAVTWNPIYKNPEKDDIEPCIEQGLKIGQPITWDKRCLGNETTSMCGEDVVESIRSHFIDLTKEEVIACYLGSDGVEDTYADGIGGSHSQMGGVHTFYKNISCILCDEIVKKDKKQFEEDLEKKFQDFSRTGILNGLFGKEPSRDDVSVAGIVNIEKIKKYLPKFQNDVKIYTLDEKILILNGQLNSKSRKHKFLKDTYLNSKKEFEKEQDEYDKFRNNYLKSTKLLSRSNNINEYDIKQREYTLIRNCKEKAEQLRKNKQLFDEFDEPFRQIENDIKELNNEKNILRSGSNYNYKTTQEIKDKIDYEETEKEKLDTIITEFDELLKTSGEELKKLEEARKKAEEEAKRTEEARKKAEEEIKKLQEEIKNKAEEEIKKLQEEVGKKAEEEIKKLQEEIKNKAEEEIKKLQDIIKQKQGNKGFGEWFKDKIEWFKDKIIQAINDLVSGKPKEDEPKESETKEQKTNEVELKQFQESTQTPSSDSNNDLQGEATTSEVTDNQPSKEEVDQNNVSADDNTTEEQIQENKQNQSSDSNNVLQGDAQTSEVTDNTQPSKEDMDQNNVSADDNTTEEQLQENTQTPSSDSNNNSEGQIKVTDDSCQTIFESEHFYKSKHHDPKYNNDDYHTHK